MIRCPNCQAMNEIGALFCFQCKYDLSALAAEPPLPPTIPVSDLPKVETLGGLDLAPVVPPVTLPPAVASTLSAVPLEPAVPPTPVPTASDATVVDETLNKPAPPSAATVTVQEKTLQLIPNDAKPRLIVLRGMKPNANYPIYPGENYIGRADEKPVDVDLTEQEPEDRVWSSRQHALIVFAEGQIFVEDLNSLNGTFVNRSRLPPHQRKVLELGDVIQIGTVQLKLSL